jgi:hypothetical protein
MPENPLFQMGTLIAAWRSDLLKTIPPDVELAITQKDLGLSKCLHQTQHLVHGEVN